MSLKDLCEKILEVFSYIPFLTLGIGFLCIKYMKGYMVPIFILVLGSVVTDIINLVLVKNHINNFYVFHLYTVFEFTAVLLFYVLFYKGQIRFYSLFLFLLPVFYAICYFDYKIEGTDKIDGMAVAIESIIFTALALLSFYLIFKKLLFNDLLSSAFFYVNFGLLLYFLGNLILFTFSTYILTKESENYLYLWIGHDVLNIAFNVLTGIAFWKLRTE